MAEDGGHIPPYGIVRRWVFPDKLRRGARLNGVKGVPPGGGGSWVLPEEKGKEFGFAYCTSFSQMV